jgi:hypothetical protein
MKTVAALSASPAVALARKKAAECGVLRADIAPSLSPRQLFMLELVRQAT